MSIGKCRYQQASATYCSHCFSSEKPWGGWESLEMISNCVSTDVPEIRGFPNCLGWLDRSHKTRREKSNSNLLSKYPLPVCQITRLVTLPAR